MEKSFLKSKTVQGILLAVVGALLGVWSGASEFSLTIVTAGLGWAGYGLRDALD